MRFRGPAIYSGQQAIVEELKTQLGRRFAYSGNRMKFYIIRAQNPGLL